jgi:hypothetical protein
MRLIEGMFDSLVDRLREVLLGFGRSLAVDGKGIDTHSRPRRREESCGKADGLINAHKRQTQALQAVVCFFAALNARFWPLEEPEQCDRLSNTFDGIV